MLGFSLVFMQETWHPFKLKPLGGVTYETQRPELTLKSFASGQYQSGIEQYSRENFGFREWAIRLYNQTNYSLFNQPTNRFVVQGKDGSTFFEESYVISYTGETYLGEEKIQDNTRQLKLIQDMLRTKGITLLPVFVLGKASYYPEIIPEEYIAKRNTTNNYQEYLKAFGQQTVEMIDFNKYFCQRPLDGVCRLAGYGLLGALHGRQDPTGAGALPNHGLRHHLPDEPGRRPLSHDEPHAPDET